MKAYRSGDKALHILYIISTWKHSAHLAYTKHETKMCKAVFYKNGKIFVFSSSTIVEMYTKSVAMEGREILSSEIVINDEMLEWVSTFMYMGNIILTTVTVTVTENIINNYEIFEKSMQRNVEMVLHTGLQLDQSLCLVLKPGP